MDSGPVQITSQHYAFLVSEEDFDADFGRIQQAGITHYADPGHRRAGEINHNDGGRGAYFEDPNGRRRRPWSSPGVPGDDAGAPGSVQTGCQSPSPGCFFS